MNRSAKRITTAGTPTDVGNARIVRRGPQPGRTLKFPLRALRVAHGLTQAQVAKVTGISQPEISKLEGETSLDDRMIATVRRYLDALGDELELVSVSRFGHRVVIVGEHGPLPAPPKKSHAMRKAKSISR